MFVYVGLESRVSLPKLFAPPGLLKYWRFDFTLLPVSVGSIDRFRDVVSPVFLFGLLNQGRSVTRLELAGRGWFGQDAWFDQCLLAVVAHPVVNKGVLC